MHMAMACVCIGVLYINCDFSFFFCMCDAWRSGNLAPSTAQNGHKGSTYQGGDSPAIASPARRSEVSPIQSHVSKHYSFIIVASLSTYICWSLVLLSIKFGRKAGQPLSALLISEIRNMNSIFMNNRLLSVVENSRL